MRSQVGRLRRPLPVCRCVSLWLGTDRTTTHLFARSSTVAYSSYNSEWLVPISFTTQNLYMIAGFST